MKQRKQRRRQRFLALVMAVMFALSNVTPVWAIALRPSEPNPTLGANGDTQAGITTFEQIGGGGRSI